MYSTCASSFGEVMIERSHLAPPNVSQANPQYRQPQNIKALRVEQWLRSFDRLSNRGKCKIRNIMSGVFGQAIGYELADRETPLPRCGSLASARRFR